MNDDSELARLRDRFRRIATDARDPLRGAADANESIQLDGFRVDLDYDARLDVDRALVTVEFGAVAPELESTAAQILMGANYLLYADEHEPVYARRPDDGCFVLRFTCVLATTTDAAFEQAVGKTVELARRWRCDWFPDEPSSLTKD